MTLPITEAISFTLPSPITSITLKITAHATGGMCSYGVGNTGSYASTFSKRDIIDQACNNPAGQFDYTQLLNQAKTQTYIITELFSTTCIPKSVFSVFLPSKTFPTTDFLKTQPPTCPNPTNG